jgi:hypothetical protein
MSGGEGRRLVEEEELGEASRLKQRVPVPAPELQPARDPAPSRVAPPDAAGRVVQAAAVSVHETPRGISDQVAERGNAVLERHGALLPLPAPKHEHASHAHGRPEDAHPAWRHPLRQ